VQDIVTLIGAIISLPIAIVSEREVQGTQVKSYQTITTELRLSRFIKLLGSEGLVAIGPSLEGKVGSFRIHLNVGLSRLGGME
jgi:hypothetical protein